MPKKPSTRRASTKKPSAPKRPAPERLEERKEKGIWLPLPRTKEQVAKAAAATAAAIAVIGAVRYRRAIEFAFHHRHLFGKIISIDWRHKRLLSRAIRDVVVTGNTASANPRMNELAAMLMREHAISEKSAQAMDDIETFLEFAQVLSDEMTDIESGTPAAPQGMMSFVMIYFWSGDTRKVKLSRMVIILRTIKPAAETLQAFINAKKAAADMADAVAGAAKGVAEVVIDPVAKAMKPVLDVGGAMLEAADDLYHLFSGDWGDFL